MTPTKEPSAVFERIAREAHEADREIAADEDQRRRDAITDWHEQRSFRALIRAMLDRRRTDRG